MSDHAFTRLCLTLLLLICACLVMLDQQRQRTIAAMRTEVDNLHGRMNAAGLIDNIPAPADPLDTKTETVFDPFAQFRPKTNTGVNAQHGNGIVDTLHAPDDDTLNVIANRETE